LLSSYLMSLLLEFCGNTATAIGLSALNMNLLDQGLQTQYSPKGLRAFDFHQEKLDWPSFTGMRLMVLVKKKWVFV